MPVWLPSTWLICSMPSRSDWSTKNLVVGVRCVGLYCAQQLFVVGRGGIDEDNFLPLVHWFDGIAQKMCRWCRPCPDPGRQAEPAGLREPVIEYRVRMLGFQGRWADGL